MTVRKLFTRTPDRPTYQWWTEETAPGVYAVHPVHDNEPVWVFGRPFFGRAADTFRTMVVED